MSRRLKPLGYIAAIVIAGGVLTVMLSFDGAGGGSDVSPGVVEVGGTKPPELPVDVESATQVPINESSSPGVASVDLNRVQSGGPTGEGLPAGVLEDSVVLNGEDLSMEASVAALGSDRFDQFVLGLERGAKSPAAAADLTSAYRLGIETSLSSLEGGQLDQVGCGETVCAFQVTTPASQLAFDGWLDRVFSSAGLPGYSFVTAPLPGRLGAPSRYRVLVTIDPSARTISSRISP